MPLRITEFRRLVRITLRSKPMELPSLLETTSFLYDFNLLYEISRLALDRKYQDFTFSNFIFYRAGRPLDDEDRLHVEKIHHGSPLDVVALIGVAAGAGAAIATAIWAIVQAIERIMNAPLNRRKLRAEVEKLERDLSENPMPSARRTDLEDPERMRDLLDRREALQPYDSTIARLSRARIRIAEIDIEIIDSRSKRKEE